MALDGGSFYCVDCLRRYLAAYLAVYDLPETPGALREEIWSIFLR